MKFWNMAAAPSYPGHAPNCQCNQHNYETSLNSLTIIFQYEDLKNASVLHLQ